MRVGSGSVRVLVDILPCLPNLSLSALIMTNSFSNVLEQSGDTAHHAFTQCPVCFLLLGSQDKFPSLLAYFCVFIDENI